jgi:EAL and modified HD-GYP domain-containing signal transduction protein
MALSETETPRVLFARQAIVDVRGRLVGYELLYRGRRGEEGVIPDAEHATCQVLLAAFAEVGFNVAVGSTTAFLNVTDRFLQEIDPLPLDPRRTVLEVLEDTDPSPALLQRLRDLRAQGFRIALDDFTLTSSSEPLLEVADIVKVDLRAHSRPDAERLIARLTEQGHTVLAEKVEDQAERDWSAAAGAQLFQGYFFCEPVELAGEEIRVTSLARLKAAAGLTNPDAGLEEVELALRTDPGLSLRLLRHLNSAALALPHRITSVRHAIVMLGARTVRQWALVLLLAGIGEHRGPLITTALTRARTCELAAEALGAPDADSYFSVGLLSIADALAGAPMERVVAELPLTDDVKAALLRYEGDMGVALAGAIACERGELPQNDPGLLLACYGDAVAWAEAHTVSE